VAVTFDDGFQDNLTVALPILKQHQWPATVFVTVEPVDTGRLLWPQQIWNWVFHPGVQELVLSWRSQNHSKVADTRLDLRDDAAKGHARMWLRAFAGGLRSEDRKEFLDYLAGELRIDRSNEATRRGPIATWDEIRQLHAAGVTIGGHTVTHPRLSLADSNTLQWEVVASRQRLEQELGAPVQVFAYPFGETDDFDERAKTAVREAGYLAAFASQDLDRSPPDLFALPRLYVPDEPAWRFGLRLLLAHQDSGFLRWLLQS
jgi:peptidoglycan/xylan/chitin deacetylase (PgdA/CDA1 family)